MRTLINSSTLLLSCTQVLSATGDYQPLCKVFRVIFLRHLYLPIPVSLFHLVFTASQLLGANLSLVPSVHCFIARRQILSSNLTTLTWGHAQQEKTIYFSLATNIATTAGSTYHYLHLPSLPPTLYLTEAPSLAHHPD